MRYLRLLAIAAKLDHMKGLNGSSAGHIYNRNISYVFAMDIYQNDALAFATGSL